MTRRFIFGILLVSGMSLTLLSQSALETYQRALVQEQAAGNLKEAITLYRQAAKEAGDRELAARSLVRAGAAEEKLADPHAVETYAEVLRSFAEQREPVSTAQARLAALRVAPTAIQSTTQAASTAIPTVVDRALKTYCVNCHGDARNVANLNLESMSAKSIAENAPRWETLLLRLRARRDPPNGMPRPDEGTFQTMISTLEVALDQAYPQNASLSTAPRVDDVELAGRMAALIWGKDSRPDEELLNTARRGALRNPATLEQQVRRMVRDSRSSALVTEFFEKWMLRGQLDQPASTQRPAALDEELRQAFANETRLFLESQIRDDRNALDLWTANYTFVNERLARLYGVPNVSGNEFRRVRLPGSDRAGILGQGSFLTVTSFANRTSPTTRGKIVMRLFTGMNPPDPPPNVPAMAGAAATGDRSMRDALSQHIANPACVSCHRIFDPWGFALENFDTVGAFRRTQGTVTVDASGAFVDGSTFSGPADFRAGLLKYRDAYYASITQSLLGFALGRQGLAWRVHENEMPAVRAIVRDAAANDYRWSAIVTGIVRSPNFQLRTLAP